MTGWRRRRRRLAEEEAEEHALSAERGALSKAMR